jgi:CRP-like cAMP-binding protein
MAEDTGLYQKFGRSVDPGETVFEEGDSGDQMFIIQEGQVRVTKKIGGREHTYAVLGKGDFFGEMAIVTNTKRTATVKAATHCKLLCFNREGFLSMINKNPKIALNIIDKLCRRLQNSNMQIQHLVKKNGRALVALNLSYAFKGEGEENAVLYYDRTLEEISLNLDLPREAVKSHVEDFERLGIVSVSGNRIALSDMNKLNAITETVSG